MSATPPPLPDPAIPPREAPRTLSGFLTVACLAVFFALEYYTDQSYSRIQLVYSTLALSLDGLKHGQLWQLFTHMFMHGGYVHLAVNCIVLYFVGRDVELLVGRTLFLLTYFGGGVLGGLVQCFASLLPGEPSGTMVGASGGLMALMGVICCLFWNQKLRLMILFLLPVKLTGRATLILLTVIDVIGSQIPQSPFAHFAHLGGLYTGFWMTKLALRMRRAALSVDRSAN